MIGPWLVRGREQAAAALDLVCLPYAGGSAAIFRDWPASIDPRIAICAIELPGRGRRLREPPYTDLHALADAVSAAITAGSDRPLAIFGHSMGGLLAFEVADRLRDRSRAPCHLFVSAAKAPARRIPGRRVHELSDEDLIGHLQKLNGIPDELLKERALLDMLLPTTRSDIRLAETYIYQPIEPFDFGISVFGGIDDTIVAADGLKSWRDQTNGDFRLHLLAGKHLFLVEQRATILNLVVRDLATFLPRLI